MGLSLEHFKNISGKELRKMTNQELKTVLQNIAMHTNARLSQLERAGLSKVSRASYNMLDNYPQGLSSKDATRNQMIKQIKAGQRYLKGKTSTVSGTKNMMENILNMVGVEVDKKGRVYNKDIDEYETTTDAFKNYFGSDFWKIVRKLEEENESFKTNSEGLIQAVYDIYDDYKGDEEDKDSKEAYISSMMKKAEEQYNDKYGSGLQYASDEDLANKYKRR